EAKVPESITFATKGDIALEQIDVARAQGVRFGIVLADAAYGMSAKFRAGLSARGLLWAVGVLPAQKVYPADVTLSAAPQPAVGASKAGWSCGQPHHQLKDELGLDHFEGRSWLGLHHHALLSMMAFAYLQHHRLLQAAQSGEKTKTDGTGATPAAVASRHKAR